MKLTPAMKIILAVAAICIAITLITTNNIATVMVLFGLNSTPVASTGTQSQAVVQQQGTVQQPSGTVSGDTGSTGNTGTVTPTPDATQPSGGATTQTTPSGNTGSTGTTDDKKPADNSGSAQSGKLSDQQVVDLYKKAVGAARTKASSVVRVKDGAINYKGIVEAGALSSVGSSLMGAFMAKDEASIEVKNEPWEKEKLPDATALTTNGLQKISYEEKGDNYVVTLVAKNAMNPKAGADGIGAISGVIEETQITGAIGSFPLLKLQNINIDYENVTTVATIDKKTGNLVALNLNSPCVLGLDAAMGPLSINGAKVGIQVITEYTIAY
ncbi:MAG: hypothetical protein E7522_05195 [Ruminococcaceae bacterium]|nr:hypothetical protein [Oscillospiraceae bacterium]